MTITFASAKSTAIQAVEIDSLAGDQSVILRYKYDKLDREDAANATGVDPECVTGKTGTIKDLAGVKAALGL